MSAVCLSVGALRGKGLEKEGAEVRRREAEAARKRAEGCRGLRKGRGRGELEERGEGLGR